MKMVSIAAVMLLLVSCGGIDVHDAGSSKTETVTDAPPRTPVVETFEALSLEGYIQSAFEVRIDGVKFDDQEAYYSSRLDILRAEADKAGYRDYDLTFDAEIGLADLKSDMHVFVAAQGANGFAGETDVQYDGRFTIAIPDNAQAELYAVRANKRVQVRLTHVNKRDVLWCFNYSTIRTSVKVDGTPLIMRDFQSSLTKYKCDTSPGHGIDIPETVEDLPAAHGPRSETVTGAPVAEKSDMAN